MENSQALLSETLSILAANGFDRVRVEMDTNGWLVGGWCGGKPHIGHTGIDPLTSGDPRDMAQRLIAIAVRESGPSRDYAAPSFSQPVEDEDPGEQDLGAEMLAAEEEAAPAPADHGGVMIHYDQVEIARAQLSMATSDHEEILVSALSNRWPDLIQAFTDTNNLAPDLWSEAQSGDRQEFMRLSSIESRIRAHAVALRRSIKDADGDQLRNIGESLTEGWPT